MPERIGTHIMCNPDNPRDQPAIPASADPLVSGFVFPG